MSRCRVTRWIAVVSEEVCPPGFAREELLHRLSSRFPAYNFELMRHLPFGDDLSVIPICSDGGDGDWMRMLPMPSDSEIAEVGDALRDMAGNMAMALN